MAGYATPAGMVARDDLSDVAVNFVQDNPFSFGAPTVFPYLGCARRVVKHNVVDVRSTMQRQNTKRTRGAGVNRSNHKVGEQLFNIGEYSSEEPMDPNDSPYEDMSQEEPMIVRRQVATIMRDMEGDFITALANTTTFPLSGDTGLSVGTPWSTIATADVVGNIQTGMISLQKLFGVKANALVINEQQYSWISRNAALRASLGSGASPAGTQGLIPFDVLASLLHPAIKRIIVLGSAVNTANLGLAASMSFQWPNANAMLCRIDEGDDLSMPQIGRSLGWDVSPELPGATGSSSVNVAGADIKLLEYAEPKTSSKLIRATAFRSLVTTAYPCGFLFGNVG
mgnify:CR=1 FL=1